MIPFQDLHWSYRMKTVWYTWQYYRVLHSLRAMDRDYHSQNRTQTRNIAMSSGRKRLPYARSCVLTLCYYTVLNIIYISRILMLWHHIVHIFCVINLSIDSVSLRAHVWYKRCSYCVIADPPVLVQWQL